jgi:hypothetical protein
VGYCWRPPSAEHCASQMPSLKAQELGESDAAIIVVSRGNRLARKFLHDMRLQAGPQGPSHIWLPRVEAWSQMPEVQRET